MAMLPGDFFFLSIALAIWCHFWLHVHFGTPFSYFCEECCVYFDLDHIESVKCFWYDGALHNISSTDP